MYFAAQSKYMVLASRFIVGELCQRLIKSLHYLLLIQLGIVLCCVFVFNGRATQEAGVLSGMASD